MRQRGMARNERAWRMEQFLGDGLQHAPISWLAGGGHGSAAERMVLVSKLDETILSGNHAL